MSEFLSNQWFEDINSRLSRPETALPHGARPCQIVVDVSDAPAGVAHALTLHVNESGAHIAPGVSSRADVTLRVRYHDAVALSAGDLDSASALRDGRIKVRGDVNVVVPLASWLHAALFE